MKKLLEICKELFIYASIGVIVGTFYLLVILSKYIGFKDIITSTVLSGFIGIAVGLSAQAVFILLKKNIIKSIHNAYFIEILLIVALSVLFSYLMGVREIKYLIIMALIALFLSFLFTFKKSESFVKTNEKLKELQEKLKEEI